MVDRGDEGGAESGEDERTPAGTEANEMFRIRSHNRDETECDPERGYA